MTLLLRCKQFLDVLRDASHPKALIPGCTFKSHDPEDEQQDLKKSEDFSSIQNHLFFCRVERALEKAGVDKVIFNKRTSCARNAFLSCNIPGIPIEKFSSHRGKGNDICLDPRCFVDHFNALTAVTQSTHMIVQHLCHHLNDMTETLRDDFSVRHNLLSMASSIRRLENHLMGENLHMNPSPPEGVINFSISSKGLTNRMFMTDATSSFLVDNFPLVSPSTRKATDSWRDLDSSERKHLRNHFAAIKRASRMVPMRAESCPMAPKEPSHFKEVVHRIATAGSSERNTSRTILPSETKPQLSAG